MTEIENIKRVLAKVTNGADWTNFDGQKDSLFVYEYDRLTEDTCDIIAECKSMEVAKFIAVVPEKMRSLITTIESQNSQIESLKAIKELAVKGLKEIACLNVDSAYSAGTIARNTFFEIERLQNEKP